MTAIYRPTSDRSALDASRDVLAATLREVLDRFGEIRLHDTVIGYTTGMAAPVPAPDYDRWRAVLDEHGGTRIPIPHDPIDAYCADNAQPRKAIRP